MANIPTASVSQGHSMPRFDRSTVAMRMSLFIAVLAASMAALQAHQMFEGIKQWHPSSYDPVAHVGFAIMSAAAVVGLLVSRMTLQAKQTAAILIAFCFFALLGVARQATYYVLP